MTRIFEALKKSQAEPARPELPSTGRSPAAPQERAAVRPSEPRSPALDPVVLPPIPEDFVIKLTHLRYALESALADRPRRVLALCSAQQREGTSTVACSLARVLAQDERARVLLVDAHVRRPGLGPLLGLQPEATLRDVLSGRAELARQMAVVERRNLRVFCTRTDRQAAGTPFPLAEFRELLAGAGSAFDWVLLDVPPVLETADAAAIAALADASVLVMRAGHVKRPVVARAAEVLRKAGARVVGTVLNRRRLEIPEFIYRRI
jgi:capsular exopolysaccharide synthesis family protein